MSYGLNYNWNVTREQAIQTQNELRKRVIVADEFGAVELVAGIDVGFPSPGNARGGVVVLRLPSLDVIEQVTVDSPVEFPYIPGLLSFREAPVILAALGRLRTKPDLLIIDGQGIAHPRRFGIASHIGVLTDTPSIGCAKSRLVGTYEPLGPLAGDQSTLYIGTEQIGTVVRTKQATKPLFISPGHRINFDTSVRLIQSCVTRYRLPEPTRLAHNHVSLKRPS